MAQQTEKGFLQKPKSHEERQRPRPLTPPPAARPQLGDTEAPLGRGVALPGSGLRPLPAPPPGTRCRLAHPAPPSAPCCSPLVRGQVGPRARGAPLSRSSRVGGRSTPGVAGRGHHALTVLTPDF